MQGFLSEHDVSCPFCGESITLLVDASAGAQQYIEDCPVCCRPIQVTIEANNDEVEGLQVDCAS